MAGQFKYTIVDLFAGIGGLSQGFIEDNSKFDLVFANDNDKWASETFKANHPLTSYSSRNIEDITAVDIYKASGGKPINVLVGGVPCQSFSMAGYRIRKSKYGQTDDRHYLFKHFIRLVKELRPEIAIIENVKGLLSMNSGTIRDEIVKDFKKLGYDVNYKVLNAADYGAPQLRQRVFFIANRIGIKNQFPEPVYLPHQYRSVASVLTDIPNLNHQPRQLDGVVLERIKLIRPGQNWTSLPKHLQTLSKHSGAYGRLDPDQPARTLTTRFDTPSVGYVTHPFEHRTLTVREGARIQGFPDRFEFKGPIMQQYKQVGNAVPVHFSRALAPTVQAMLDNGLKRGKHHAKKIPAIPRI